MYQGGCGTLRDPTPPKLDVFKKDSPDECFKFCKATADCHYFEYVFSSNDCHLFAIGITKGDGSPNVKCYKMNKKGEKFELNY